MTLPLLPALAASLVLICGSAPAQTAPPSPAKVLRYAFPIAETGFDPAQISDLYSRTITANIFESPLTYDYLARPARIKPQTAQALPEISDDFKRFIFRIRPGIYFADDPVFKGVRRELVAADYVYSIKRYYDPQYKSPSLYLFENAKLLGLSELRRKAIADKTPFPYDTEVAGLRTLDRYSFEVVLAAPSPRLHYQFADPNVTGAVAREVVEAYPGRSMEHPVGTGPFVLKQWQRSAKIVLERNPTFREQRYDEQAAVGDEPRRAAGDGLAGRRLPMLDRVEVSIIEEQQPRWLAFLNGQHDMLERLPNEYASIAAPNNRLAPNLAKRGVQMGRVPLVDVTVAYFGMEHPWWAATRPRKWRCAAQSRWLTTSARRSRSCGAARPSRPRA